MALPCPHSLASRPLAGALALLGLTVAIAGGSVLAQEDAPSEEELGRLITLMQDSAAANPGRGDLTELPEMRDPAAPATVLYEVVAGLEALTNAGTLNRGDQRKVEQALGATKQALDAYGAAGNPADVIEKLGVAARNLMSVAPGPPDANHDALNRVSGQLAMVAHDIAGGLVQTAEEAGVGPRLAVAQTALFVGEQLQAQGVFFAAIGQFGGAANFAANTITFDIDLFEQNLIDALEGETIGYAYSIGKDGVAYSEDFDGDARTATDGQVDQSPFKEMYVASISKTISAVALLKALAAEGISVDAGISAYLPEDWTQGDGVDDVTFRHLLTHRSGLDTAGLSAGSLSGQTLATLEQIIEDGSDGILDFEDAVYTNANFSLLRILIPRVLYDSGVIANYVNVLPEDYVYAALYAQYVANEVLSPAGISVAGCSPDDGAGTRTLYYSVLTPAAAGIDWGDWSLACGATGWYLSANELSSLLAHLRYTNDIISDQTRDLMDDGYLGWLNPITFASYVDGDWGVYRAHGGDIGAGSNPGMSGCMMNFPIQVEATVLINSRGGSIGGHICTVLRDAFDNAWTGN